MSRYLRPFAVLLVILLLAGLASPTLAQSPEFRLDPRREFGYGNGANVRGNFSLSIYGDQQQIRSVTFLVDETEMGTVNQPPFVYKFNTDTYPAGWRSLTAVIETQDGRTVTTPVVRLNFLTAEQEREGMTGILVPIFGGIIGLSVIGVLAQMFLLRGDNKRLAPGTPRKYGLKGGTICPRCSRPYSIHFWSINLLTGALDRCDFCGKWAIVRRRPAAALAAAEQAELQAARAAESGPIGSRTGELTQEEQLRKRLEESKYRDS